MKRRLWIPIGGALLLLIVWLATPLPRPLFPDDYSTVVVDRDGRRLRVFLNSAEQWCFPPDSFVIPEKLVISAVTYEDKRFYKHFGIDPIAFFRAVGQNLRKGRIVSGASTITMQVARIANPKRRSIFNKFIEAIHSIKIELKYSKEDILRLYFDHAPYGGNIRGYRAACLRYWGIEAEEITWGEAAALAVLPNSPSLINPDTDAGELRAKRDRLLRKLHDHGHIDDETLELSLLEPIPRGQIPFEFTAPHLCRSLARRYSGEFVTTTIDYKIQRETERLASRHAEWLQSFGVKNVAVLVADTRTGDVLAYVGSNDFHDDALKGKVDGVRAPRSTGSLLKPFLYALAMDEAIIIPETQIKDIPTFYGAFAPHNADMSFSGLVTARDALIRSLNVPAVRLLYAYGLHDFYSFLQNAGMSYLFRSPDEYGLPIILGGCEGSLWEMVSIFRGLGNGGVFSGLNTILGDSIELGDSLISTEACWTVLDIIQNVNRPGAEYYWHQYSSQRPISWKTGTSYGHRDAWAIGVTPKWTIGVWTGNFTGEGNPNLIGSQAAGILLFKVFNSLKSGDLSAKFERPESMVKLGICRQTGFLATDKCEMVDSILVPPNCAMLRKCPYHRTLFLDEDEKYQVCSRCWEHGKVKSVTRLVYPPEIVQFFAQKGHSYLATPPHNPNCPVQGYENPVMIIYPTAGAKILVPRGFEGKHERIIARGAYSVAKSSLNWFLDGDFIGSTFDKHEIPLDLEVGSHSLTAMDSEGHSATVKFSAYMK